MPQERQEQEPELPLASSEDPESPESIRKWLALLKHAGDAERKLPRALLRQRLKEYVSDQPQFVFFSGHGIAPSGWAPLASLQQHVGLHERVVSH